MNKLKTMLCAFCTLVLVNLGTSVSADSGGFAGPYVGFSLMAAGIEMDGTSTETSDGGGTNVSATDEVEVGKATAVVGFEAGYALPIGNVLLLDVGGSYLSGEAKIEAITDDTAASGNASFKVDDVVTVYIAPTIALSETSSLYVKIGLTEADVGVSGDITTPANLSGQTLAVGTRSVLDSGVFIRTEAGMIDYNGISAHGKNEGNGSNQAIPKTTSYSAEPLIAYGQISLGMRF